MQEVNAANAANLATEFVKQIIQYQPNLFGAIALNGEDQAKQVAQSVAALRAELIEKLKPQL